MCVICVLYARLNMIIITGGSGAMGWVEKHDPTARLGYSQSQTAGSAASASALHK